jgi:hypothetical protein
MATFTRQLELPGIDLDLSALDRWVRRFPEKEVRQAVVEITQQQEALSRLRQDLEERLALFEKLAHPMPDMRHSATPIAELTASNGGRAPSAKRQLILTMLGTEPARAFPFEMIVLNVVGHGLMENSAKARKALSVMLATMIEKGEIHRPERATYKFGPDPTSGRKASTLTNVQGEDGDGS